MYRDGTRIIPNDVSPQEWVSVILCIPKDSEWFALFRGLVWQLTRGRGWQRDSRETSIKDAQAIGMRIYDSMAICDLETALNGIESAIRALERTTAVNVCCDVGTQPTDPPDIDPYDPNDPPVTIPPHLPQDEDDLLCHLLNTAYGALLKYLDVLETVSAGSFGVALIVSLLAILYPEPITTVLGGVTLTMIATSLLGWSGASANVAIVIGEWIDAIEENFTEFYCSVRGVTDYLDAVDQWFTYMSEQLRLKLIEHGAPEWVARALSGWIDLSSWAKAVYAEWYTNGEWMDSYPANPLSCSCVPVGNLQNVYTFTDNTQTWVYDVYANNAIGYWSSTGGRNDAGCLRTDSTSTDGDYGRWTLHLEGQGLVVQGGSFAYARIRNLSGSSEWMLVRYRFWYTDGTYTEKTRNGKLTATWESMLHNPTVGKTLDRIEIIAGSSAHSDVNRMQICIDDVEIWHVA